MQGAALTAVAEQRRKASLPSLAERLQRVSVDLIRASHHTLPDVIASGLAVLGEGLEADEALLATKDANGLSGHRLWERHGAGGSTQSGQHDPLASFLCHLRLKDTLVCSARKEFPSISRGPALPDALGSAIVVPLPSGARLKGIVAVTARTARSWIREEIGATEWLVGMVAAGLDRLAGLSSIDREQEKRLRAEAETRRLRDQLAHAGRISMLGELAASLAHELKQPLAAIYMNAQAAERFLDRKPPELGNVTGALHDLSQDCRRAADVLDRLRDMFRRHETEGVPVGIGELVGHVLRLLHEDAVARDVDVAVDVRPRLPPVRGDRVQLEQVLMNLLVNAFDAVAAAKGRREVTIRASRGKDFVEMAVADTGSGIESDDLGRIFDPFFTRKQNGMGMGLAISRTIVEAHGGRISARNRPDGGSVFTVRLPAIRG